MKENDGVAVILLQPLSPSSRVIPKRSEESVGFTAVHILFLEVIFLGIIFKPLLKKNAPFLIG